MPAASKFADHPGYDRYGNPLFTPSTDHFHAITQGDVPGHSFVHKFGKNEAITSSFKPLTIGGIYQTPQVGGATALRIKAGGNIQDSQIGTGAGSVVIYGLDPTGAAVSEILLSHATDGTLAGPAGSQEFIRTYSGKVGSSGAYATSVLKSHVASIIVENASGGNDWLTIDATGIARARTQIGFYTVPLGFYADVHNYILTTDSNKAVDFLFFERPNILETAPPYSAMELEVEEVGIQGHLNGEFKGGKRFSELTDIGFMVRSQVSAIATVSFEILLVAK
jgi:hypothetical protein